MIVYFMIQSGYKINKTLVKEGNFRTIYFFIEQEAINLMYN
jgi:hypothetical protein